MHSRYYIVVAVVLALLMWGPLDHDDPWGLVIRLGYLVLVPLFVWFVLMGVWKQWRPDAVAEDRLERTLHGMTSGVMLAWMLARLEDGYQKVHDAGPIFLQLLFGSIFFYWSVTKTWNQKD